MPAIGKPALLLALVILALGCASAKPPAIPAGGPAKPPLQVGILLLDGTYNTELTAPYDVFHHTASHTDPGMRVFTVGRTREAVTTYEGMRIQPDHDLRTAPPIDVLVVPSGEHNKTTDLADLDLIQWLGQRGVNAKHVLSLCDGAFLLAESGLLRDRQCTTYPDDCAEFRKQYPHIPVVENVSFVVDHETITGAGGARSFDPALYLVEKLYGKKTAEGVAKGLVIDWQPERTPHKIVESEAGTAERPTG